MATACTQEAILDFLKENGGKVKNSDLIEHFRAVFPEDPEEKAAVRNSFKNYIDNVAFVKTDSGVKHVCLKKKFRSGGSGSSVSDVTNVTQTEPVHVLQEEKGVVVVDRYSVLKRADSEVYHDAMEDLGEPVELHTPAPGSGYGNSQVRVSQSVHKKTDDKGSSCQEFVCVVEDVDRSSSVEMGNTESFRRDSTRKSKKKKEIKERFGSNTAPPGIPHITVVEASPLPAQDAVFVLPGPVLKTGSTGRPTGQVNTATTDAIGLSPTDRHVQSESIKDSERHNNVIIRHRQHSKGFEREDFSDVLDTHSLSGSEGNDTPKGSRHHFMEVMMSSSPQVRRSVVLRSSVYLSRSESDSASLVSSNLDEDRTSMSLEPLEHEWMMCSSDGDWGGLSGLLAHDPGLVLRKDFVTGFTCLHWAAKHGKPELIALIINYAKQHHIPISVDVRSNTGYTPLHIAAMHNHTEVVKLLVGAYSADVEIRDYSGRKASQYLSDNVSVDLMDIIGAEKGAESQDGDGRDEDEGRWRFSKVLPSNLKPLNLLNPSDCECVDGEVRSREKPVRRMSSFSRMKPKLQRLRLRTSQIVHSTSFRDSDQLEEGGRGSFRARPKTHFFG